MKSSNIWRAFWGIGLIVIGVLWLVSNFVPEFQVDWTYIWPLFLLVPGLFMWGSYLVNPKSEHIGKLIPANILTALAITFYINIIGSELLNIQGIWAFTAFMYPGSIAFAFFITWLFSREIGFLIPTVILSCVTIMIFCGTSGVALLGGEATESVSKFVWPTILICGGIFVVLSPLWSGEMLKKSKVMGKTEQEWEQWGENLGKSMEKKFGGTGQGSKTEVKSSTASPTDVQEAELIEDDREE